MTGLDWISAPATQSLALTLLHFVWQGLVVAGGTAAVASRLEPRRADLRYRAFVGALVLMVACPLATFVTLGGFSTDPPDALSIVREPPAPDHGRPGLDKEDAASSELFPAIAGLQTGGVHA